MIGYRRMLASALLACVAVVNGAAAQPLGTFRWQVRPFCNVITVAITQNGAVYRLEGTDDQCGNGADAASVTGTAFPNADGTIGFGLNIVTAPGGRPLHVDAEINLGTFSGTWRDSAGATGTFAFTPGAGNGGSPRPLPTPGVPSAFQLRSDGGFVAGGSPGVGAIPATGAGARMMWYPAKSAFRAGAVSDGGQWDDSNVGVASAATGFNTTASGAGSAAMGQNTTASGGNSTAMGANTAATGNQSTAMGNLSAASGLNALAGGSTAVAAGDSSLAFGAGVRANGNGSVALGTGASASRGSFVFADNSSTSLVPSGINDFVVRASGGFNFYSNTALTLGVRLATNGVDWTSLSDVRAKHHFRELDGDDVLAKIAQMPVTEWSYKEQDAAIRHIGPTAQDFHAAFGLGQDPLRIGTLDADGVALAGVRALEARTRSQSERIDALEQKLADALAALCALGGDCH